MIGRSKEKDSSGDSTKRKRENGGSGMRESLFLGLVLLEPYIRNWGRGTGFVLERLFRSFLYINEIDRPMESVVAGIQSIRVSTGPRLKTTGMEIQGFLNGKRPGNFFDLVIWVFRLTRLWDSAFFQGKFLLK